MGVKVNGNRGLHFTGSFDISEIENNAKRAASVIGDLQKQANAVKVGTTVDGSQRTEQLAMQKALEQSRLAVQRLKEEQQAQRNEQEKSKTVIAAERAEVEKLRAAQVELTNQLKAQQITAQQYALEQRKIADAQRQATLAQKEAERTLREQVKLQKEQEKQAERNRKALEAESSEYAKLTKALGSVRKEAKDVAAEMFRLEREGLNASDAYRQLEIRSKALTAQTTILDQGVKRIDASLGLHQRNVGNYGAAISNLSPMFASIDQSLGNFGTSIDDLAKRPDPFKALGTSLMAFGRSTVAFLATPIGAIMALLGGLYALISSNKQTVVEFDSGLKGVQKTAGESIEDLEGFGDSIIKLSNNLKSVSAVKLLEYAEAAGTLGVKGSANLLKFTETLAKLETASDISGEEGAKAIARLLDITDGGVENVQAFGHSIVNLGNNLAASESEILDNATRIAQSTSLYKVGRDEVLAYAAATRAAGLQSEVVGSSFARTFGAIEASLRTGKNIETFAAVTGKSVQQLKKDFKDDASGVFNSFIKGLNGVSEAGGSVQGVLASLSITSTEDQRVIATLAGKYEDLEEAMNLSRNAGTAMTDEFELANTKLENVGKRMGVAWDNFVLSIENGQGVFAKTGAYIGNEFANILVATKDLVDDFGTAFKVAGQFMDDYRPKVQEAGKANVIYADSLQPIKDFFSQISLRNFVFTFTVEIPNALRTAGAYLDILKTTVENFARFVSQAGPEISKALKNALNPFAESSDTSGLDKLWEGFKRSNAQANQFILDDTNRTNQEAINLFKQRYKDAEEATVKGEEALAAAKAKGLNGALAAAIEAELAAADAVSAASKNKSKQAEEAAKRAEEAAKRAAIEAAGASEDAKAAADEAATRAADAAAKAREAANQAVEAAKQRLEAQRAMQAKIDELNTAAHRKELSQNEAEIQAVKDKYIKIRKEIDEFYRNPKNRGMRVDASGLPKAEQTEIDNVTAKQEVEALKVSIAEQKQLYQEFEQYKSEFGAEMASQRFKGDLAEYESYIAYLRSLMPSEADTSIKANKLRKALEPLLVKAEKEANEKAFDANAKNLRRIIDQTITANTERLRIEKQYFEDLATLQGNLTGEANAQELAERTALLDERKRQELEANRELAFQQTDFFRKMMRDITYMARDEMKQRVKEIKKILSDPKLSPVERATANSALQDVRGYLAETNKAAEDAREIEAASMVAASSFNAMGQAVAGMNPQLSSLLTGMGQLAGIAGSAAGAFASFSTGDILGGITQGISAMTGIIGLIDNSEEKQRRAEERRAYAQELQIKSMEAATKALERQLAAIEEIYGVERLQAYGNAIDEINKKIAEQTESIADKYVLTGDAANDKLLKQLNENPNYTLPGLDGYLKDLKASTYTLQDLVEGVANGSAESIEELQQLLDKGLLDESTAAIVEDLLANVERAKQALNEMREEATGLNFDSAVDGLLSLFEQGKTAAKDFAEYFDGILKDSLLNAFKRNVLEKAMQPFYDLLYESSKDGKLSDEEIDSLDTLATEISDKVKGQFEEYKTLIDGLTDPDVTGPEEKQDTLTGAIRGQLTEETGGKLAGIYQGIFGLNKQMLVVQERQLNLQEGMYNNMGHQLDIGKQAIYYQQQIANNTLQNAESSIRIESKLEKIINNTNPGMDARGMGLGG
jgi:TP901 family phage tail tape measure protein